MEADNNGIDTRSAWLVALLDVALWLTLFGAVTLAWGLLPDRDWERVAAGGITLGLATAAGALALVLLAGGGGVPADSGGRRRRPPDRR